MQTTHLVLGALDGVRTVADVAANVDAEVTTDGAGGRVGGVGGAQHNTASLDGVVALPHHAAHGAHHHVPAENAIGIKNVSQCASEQQTQAPTSTSRRTTPKNGSEKNKDKKKTYSMSPGKNFLPARSA